MNYFSPSHSIQKKIRFLSEHFLPSPFFIGVWVITLFLMMIVGAIAVKGLIEPNLLSSDIINPVGEQTMTPSPFPAPQLIITPNIVPPPPNSINSSPLPSKTFPIWLFIGIVGGSAFISLLVTAWLRYLSLPTETQSDVANFVKGNVTLVFKIIVFVITFIPVTILNIFKYFINSFNSLSEQYAEYKIEQSKKTPPKKRIQKPAPQTKFTPPPQYYPVVEPIYNFEMNGNYNPSYNPSYDNGNYGLNRQPQKKRSSGKKPSQPRNSAPNYGKPPQNNVSTQKRKTPVSPRQKQPFPSTYPQGNPSYYEPEVTILSPEEKSPLDKNPPTLAELMDLRRNRSLSSLLNDHGY
jgi:hypothetical protein